MKNVLFGLAVGVVVGYVLRRMEDQGQFECLENELHGLTDKAKILDVTFFQLHSSYKKRV